MRRLALSLRTDWFRVLVDLQDGGCGNTDVAEYLGVARSTLRGWKDGSEPSHHDGMRLLELWQAITGHSYERRPLTRF